MYRHGMGQAQTARDRAAAAYDAGVQSSDAGDYGVALTHFQEAYRLVPLSDTLVAIGAVLAHLGRTAEARQRYLQYLREAPNGPLAAQARSALDRLPEFQKPMAPAVPDSLTRGSAPAAAASAFAVPAQVPSGYARGSTTGVLIATGIGAAVVMGLGVYLVRRRRPRRNRHRNRR